jgi:hypothetical protein
MILNTPDPMVSTLLEILDVETFERDRDWLLRQMFQPFLRF